MVPIKLWNVTELAREWGVSKQRVELWILRGTRTFQLMPSHVTQRGTALFDEEAKNRGYEQVKEFLKKEHLLREQHGNAQAYNAGCRCDLCREAHSIRMRKTKAQRFEQTKNPDDPRHGTRNFYANYGCRCDRCKATIPKRS